MESLAEQLRQRLGAYAAHNAAGDREFEQILILARQVQATDREAGPVLLDLAAAAGISKQARHGQLIQALAQADRVKAARAGLAPWIATHLDTTPGKARGITECARTIGAMPQLTTDLTSGKIGGDTVGILTRAVKAIAHTGCDKAETVTEILELTQREGVSAAKKRVRVLEESIEPGRAEKLLAAQRERSFLRINEVASGMVRIEGLLDPARAVILRAAIDLNVAACIRARHHDGTDQVPEDVRSIEQLQAHTLVRLAEVFLTADPHQREAAFTPPALYHTPLHPGEGELAESVYGDLVPLSAIAPMGDSAAHLIEHLDGQPILLDGKPIDTDPGARSANTAQRTALAFRDRTCSEEGCDRPPTWSLNAHHLIPYSQGGATTMENLTLLCSEHHILTHHPEAKRQG